MSTADTTEATEATEDQQCTESEQRHYEAICAAEKGVYDLEMVYMRAKSDAAATKKNFESASASLRSLIRNGVGQLTLPGMGDELNEEWRELPMSELGISDAQVEKFSEAGVKTMGDFSTLTARSSGRWHTSIAGIGEATADKIDLAFMQFWVDHPEYGEKEEELGDSVATDRTKPEGEREAKEDQA